MKKEFVPYTESLALKELGFDEPCLAFYYNNPTNQLSEPLSTWAIVEDYKNVFQISHVKCTAPTFSQAFRWFREKHKLFISFHRYRNSVVIEMPDTFPKVYEIWIQDENKDESVWVECFDTYEEAETACLNKLIEIVKTNE